MGFDRDTVSVLDTVGNLVQVLAGVVPQICSIGIDVVIPQPMLDIAVIFGEDLIVAGLNTRISSQPLPDSIQQLGEGALAATGQSYRNEKLAHYPSISGLSF